MPPRKSDEWDYLKERFENDYAALKAARIQPPPVGTSVNKRVRRRLRAENYDNNLIETASATEQAELLYWQTTGLEIADLIEQQIAARRASATLALDWGAFQFACGVVLSSIFLFRRDEARIKAGDSARASLSKIAKRSWIARELKLRIEEGMRRHSAEAHLAREIQDALRKGIPEGFNEKWLEDLLNKEGVLKSSYTKKKLPTASLADLAERAIEIPPLPRTRRFIQHRR